MKLNAIIPIIFSLLILQSFCGCFGNNHGGLKYDFYVDDDYKVLTHGWGVDHFNTINDALILSSDNQSIFVYDGIYNETLIINKTILLKGENAFETIIDGEQKVKDIIHVEGNGQIDISGFTISNCGEEGNKEYDEAGIDLRSRGNKIWGNILINNTCGIYTRYSSNNKVIDNKFINNYEYGAYFHTGSDKQDIIDNVFISNNYALRIQGNINCNVTYNIFLDNNKGLYVCCGSNSNFVYGNIFSNNTDWDAHDHYQNYWHTESPSSWAIHFNEKIKKTEKVNNVSIGNFWDAYYLESQGAYDNNSDGIIDTFYDIPNVKNNDNYPLAEPPIITNPFFKTEDLSIE